MRRVLAAASVSVSLLVAACGSAPEPQISVREVAAAGLQRSYAVSVPSDASQPLPVIIALHGRGDDGFSFLTGTGLDSVAAIVAAPDGAGAAFAPAPYAETTFAQDSAMVDAIVEDLDATFSVKSSHVFLVGFSNGGGFATALAAERPERFAGVATVAAAVRTDPKELSRGQPIDYLNIHGKADIKVPYAGESRSGGDRIFGAEDVVAAFRVRNGTSARTEHLAVAGMEHGWPTGSSSSGGVDVNEEILSFFGLN